MKKICSVMLVIVLVLTSIVATPVEAKSKAKWITTKKFPCTDYYATNFIKGKKAYETQGYYVHIVSIKKNRITFWFDKTHKTKASVDYYGSDCIKGKIKGTKCKFKWKGDPGRVSGKGTGTLTFKKNGTFKMKIKGDSYFNGNYKFKKYKW